MRLLEELCKVVDSSIKNQEIKKRQLELKSDLNSIIAERDASNSRSESRIQRCISLSKEENYGSSELVKYDHEKWFDIAVNEDIKGLVDRKSSILSEYTFLKDKYTWKDTANYKQTDWFQFQEEIKKHQAMAYEYLTDKVFSKMDLESL